MDTGRADQDVVGQGRRQKRVQLVPIVERADRLAKLLFLPIARTPAAKLGLAKRVQNQASQNGNPRLPRQLAARFELGREHEADGEHDQRGDVTAEPEANAVLDQLLVGNELHDAGQVRLQARLSEP